jgi:hypothetical protein
MKIAGNIVSVIVLLIGALWTLQGLNVLAGSVMSGQTQWLVIGLILVVVGILGLWWINFRRK